MPDSGQEHTADGDDGFFVSTACFYAAVTICKFRMFPGFDQSVCNLHQNWFKIGTSTGNPRGFDLEVALVIAGTASRPGDEVFGCGEDRHIRPDLREHLNSSKRVLIETRHGSDKGQDSFVWITETKDFPFYFVLVMFQFIDVVEALPELDSLFGRDGAVNGSLNLFDRSFTPAVHKRCHVKNFPRVLQNVFRDGTGRFSEDIRKDIIQLKVGYGKTVMGTVLLAGDHVGKFETVSYQIPKLSDISGRNKRRFDHAAHIEVADPFGVFTVGFVSFLRPGVFGVRKSNPKVMFLQYVENRDPVLAGRFHTNIHTVIFGKPVTQLIQALGKGRKASLLIFCTAVGIGNTDTGKDPGFVDIQPATVVFDNFKRQ